MFTPQSPRGYNGDPRLAAIAALPPYLGRIVLEQQIRSGASPEVILGNFLGVASFVCGLVANVRVPWQEPLPLTLNVNVMGGPGTGKSTSLRRAMKPLRKATASIENKGSTEDGPGPAGWVFGDATPAGLIDALSLNGGAGILSLEEGGSYLDSPLGRANDLKANLFDGVLPPITRATRKTSNLLSYVRFASVVNVQPELFRMWFARQGLKAVASGYLARVIIVQAPAAVHPSLLSGVNIRPESALLEWDTRIAKLLAQGRRNALTSWNQLPDLGLSREAALLWSQTANAIRAQGQLSGPCSNVPALLARLPEWILRVAGVLHIFEDFDGLISADTISRATEICQLFAEHWMAIVAPPPPLPTDVLDARPLLLAMHQHCQNNRIRYISKCDLDIVAKNLGLSPARTGKALLRLIALQQVRFFALNRSRRAVEHLELLGPAPAYY